MQSSRRPGVTLVELLVVIAIIALLAGLLLPAVIQARSAARTAQCQSNLSQLAKAVQGFENQQGRLPPYWGAINGGAGEAFGGWLFHLLPHLEQQPAYDRVRPVGSVILQSGSAVETFPNVSYDTVGWNPPIPASDDYSPGTWVTKSGTFYDSAGNQVIRNYEELEGAAGSPALPATPILVATATTWTTSTIMWTGTNWGRVSPDYPTMQTNLSLPWLLDAEDPSPERAPVSGTATGYENAPLTNYQMNAHVLTRFGGRAVVDSGTSFTGLFTIPPIQPISGSRVDSVFARPNLTGSGGSYSGWSHAASGSCGPVGRTFDHITDGASNVILAAEGMRRCDAMRTYRYAFLPTSPNGTTMWFHEHAFGIMPTLRQTEAGEAFAQWLPGTNPWPTFGHTLMFQTRPRPDECNFTRVQALHGDFLMVVFCDGAVKQVSSYVARREPIGVSASGRQNFGTTFFNSKAFGAGNPDRVWDQIMLPADGRTVVLNTGTAGILEGTGERGQEGETK